MQGFTLNKTEAVVDSTQLDKPDSANGPKGTIIKDFNAANKDSCNT